MWNVVAVTVPPSPSDTLNWKLSSPVVPVYVILPALMSAWVNVLLADSGVAPFFRVPVAGVLTSV